MPSKCWIDWTPDDSNLGPEPVAVDYDGVMTHQFPEGMFPPEERWSAWRRWTTNVFGLGPTEEAAIEQLCRTEQENAHAHQ